MSFFHFCLFSQELVIPAYGNVDIPLLTDVLVQNPLYQTLLINEVLNDCLMANQLPLNFKIWGQAQLFLGLSVDVPEIAFDALLECPV